VKRDEAGTVLFRALPEMLYYDARRSPAGQMGLFPPGSNYHGMTVYPLMSALEFLKRLAFPQAHRQARAFEIVEQRSLPQTAQKYLQRVRSFPIQMTFSYDAAVLTVTYEEGGLHYKERMFAVVEDRGQLRAGRGIRGLGAGDRADPELRQGQSAVDRRRNPGPDQARADRHLDRAGSAAHRA
jgi:hypothetical protein